VRARVERLGARLVEEEHAVVRAGEALAAARDALARASSERPLRPDELAKVIEIELDACEGERARVVVTYVVPGARWMPAYTVRLDGAATEIELRAIVQQKTGEDWRGVRLALSTAARQRRGDAPELTSVRVGRAQATPRRRGFRAPPEGADALYADYDRAIAAMTPAQTTTAIAADEDIDRSATFGAAPGAEPPLGFGPPSAPVPSSAPSTSRPTTKIDGRARMGLPPTAPPPGMAMAPRAQPAAPAQISAPMELAAAMSMPRRALYGAAGGAATLTVERHVEPTIDLEAAAFAASYASLRMGAVGSANRGELVPIGEAELYVEATTTVRVAARVRVAAGIAAARDATQELLRKAPPLRYLVPAGHEGYDHAFELDAIVDVPADGEPHALSISRVTAAAELVHVAVPRESRDAYRQLRVTSPFDAPLLAGPLDVYEGRDFVLSTDLTTTPPHGELEIGLGVDPAVKIARNTRFSEATTGLIRGTLELRHGVTIDVANQRADVLHLEVRERVPTTRDKEEDIEVEVTRVQPPWKKYEPDDGHLRGGHAWRIDVAAGAKQALELEYVVRIASKNELVGGNRRES
ncbi:MAG TPA: DUF4139 domain-containing protein, partial [Byssovorax sp.]